MKAWLIIIPISLYSMFYGMEHDVENSSKMNNLIEQFEYSVSVGKFPCILSSLFHFNDLDIYRERDGMVF